MNYRKGKPDRRGKAKDRAVRKRKLLWRHGNGTTCPCVHCGTSLDFETLEQDRIIPGGPYAMENVQPSCRECNVERGDSPITPYPVSRKAA